MLALPSLPAAYVPLSSSRTFLGASGTASGQAQTDAERVQRDGTEREHVRPLATSSTGWPAGAAGATSGGSGTQSDFPTSRTFFSRPGDPSSGEAQSSTERLERECLEHEGHGRVQSPTRLEQEPSLEQEQTLQALATVVRTAADEATAGLAEQVRQLTLKLTDMPSAIVRDLPAAVREHDELEAVRLAENANESNLQRQLAAALTCTEIGKIPGFTYNEDENTLTCDDCFRYSSSKDAPPALKRGARDAGVFKGTDLTPVQVRGRGMRPQRPMSTVRWELKHHCRAGALHDWCVIYADEQRKETRKALSAGLACATSVYEGIKEHDSYRSYERRIGTLYRLGVPVGTKNHSREFARQLTKAIYRTTVDCIQAAITNCDPATASALAPKGRPPPIAPLADKATINRRTGQMHGLITFIGGELVAIFVSVLLVVDSTGDGLAKLQIETYMCGRPFRFSHNAMRVQMTGGAYDGQYQGDEQGNVTGLDVPRHFCQRLCLNPNWHLSKWDRAHKIELAMKDTREMKGGSPKSIKFYLKLASVVAEAQSLYLYGKGHERVLQGHRKLNQRMRTIGTVCTTRFCHSERKVYKAFAGNLVVFVVDMETVRKGETGIAAQIAAIKTVTFVVHLFGVIDLLRPLKNLSLVMQAVNVLPWEQDDHIAVFLKEIELLEGDLRSRKLTRLLTTVDSRGNQHVAFEYLARHEVRLKRGILELEDQKTGVGVEHVTLLNSSQRRCSRSLGHFGSATEEFDAALDDLADLARDISDKVNARLMNTHAEERAVNRMRIALDLRIMAYPTSALAKKSAADLTYEASQFVALDSYGLATGDRIEVLVQADPPLWWPASLGGPAAGAGIHGVQMLYDAFPAQGYMKPIPSRIAFQRRSIGPMQPGSNQNVLWDAEENAWWPWRSLPRLAMPVEFAPDSSLAGAPSEPAARAAFDSLLHLLDWMNSRFDDAPEMMAAANPDPMPGIAELWRQRCKLETRLQMFAESSPYKRLWEGQSGTAIMRTAFTELRFNEGCGDFLHLFKHMAAKTANEAVVEGMGSFWDDCTAPKRHLQFDTGVEEAVICYSGPPQYSADATPFLTRALNTYFDGGPEKWNFAHEDQRFRGIVWAGGSKVLDRLSKVKSRLPSAVYGRSVV